MTRAWQEGYRAALKDLYSWYVTVEHYRPDSAAAQMMNSLYARQTGEHLGTGGEYEDHHEIVEAYINERKAKEDV